ILTGTKGTCKVSEDAVTPSERQNSTGGEGVSTPSPAGLHKAIESAPKDATKTEQAQQSTGSSERTLNKSVGKVVLEEGEEDALEEEEEAADPGWWIGMGGEERLAFMISVLECDERVTNKLFGPGAGDTGIERRRLVMCTGFIAAFVALEEAKKEAGRRKLERWHR
ncbi:hypothetical protein TeGR_g12486, partial [Tetraparma gracilis]